MLLIYKYSSTNKNQDKDQIVYQSVFYFKKPSKAEKICHFTAKSTLLVVFKPLALISY